MKLPAGKQLLLIDGIGATLSAFFLGIVLVRFHAWIGMPIPVLNVLAGLALVFAIYSFGSYFFSNSNWRAFLRFIAVVNLLYCFATLILVIWHFEKLTSLGILYFVLEIMLIVLLVSQEFTGSKAD